MSTDDFQWLSIILLCLASLVESVRRRRLWREFESNLRALRERLPHSVGFYSWANPDGSSTTVHKMSDGTERRTEHPPAMIRTEDRYSDDFSRADGTLGPEWQNIGYTTEDEPPPDARR